MRRGRTLPFGKVVGKYLNTYAEGSVSGSSQEPPWGMRPDAYGVPPLGERSGGFWITSLFL
jgi:hypothetical protein